MRTRKQIECDLRACVQDGFLTMDMNQMKALKDRVAMLQQELKGVPLDPVDLGVIELTKKTYFEFYDGTKFNTGPQGLAYINGKAFRIEFNEEGVPVKAIGEVLDSISQSMAPAIYAIKVVNESIKKLKPLPQMPEHESVLLSSPTIGQEVKPVLFKGDWYCKGYGHYNYKERMQCTRCGEARDAEAAKNLGIASPPKKVEKK